MLTACATKPTDYLKLTPSSLADRQLQSKIYEDVTEQQILSASVGIFQDLGVTIVEAESELGLIVGEKMRDARAFFEPGDRYQKIKFSLVTGPATAKQDGNRWVVRLTIQRIVWNRKKRVTKAEAVRDVEIYQGFFKKLNKSLFLEKQS